MSTDGVGHGATFTLQDLLEWSSRLPEWERDALRRILQNGALSHDDLDKLLLLAKHGEKVDGEGTPRAVPATKERIGAAPSEINSVAIFAISDIRHVNALGEGPVEFAGSGLSILYGENGSGKSGIARILRQTCTARAGAGVVHPNVFEASPYEPPSASIRFAAGERQESHTWTPGADPHPDLKSVHVFDSESADIWVSSDNRATYTPWLVTVLRLLAEGCLAVGERLRDERASLEASATDLADLELHPGTRVHDFVSTLHATTTDREIDDVCRVGDAEKERLKRLEPALKDDPSAKSSDRKALRRRVLAFQERMQQTARDLGENSINRFIRDWKEAEEAADEAVGAGEAIRELSTLAGVGEREWRQMWEAASTYSTATAYPGHEFPNLSGDAVCVLCQQALGNDASGRMRSFAKFVGGEVQRRADELQRSHSKSQRRISSHTLQRPTRLTVDDLGIGDRELARQVRQFLLGAERRRRQVERATASGEVGALNDMPDTPDLTEHMTAIDQDILNLERAADEAGRASLVRKRDELRDRVAVAPKREVLRAERDRLARVAALDRAHSRVNAGRITRKQGDVEKVLVTQHLQEAFRNRLLELGFSEVPIEVALGEGRRGVHPVGLRLDAKLDVKPHLVLSEGERTAVALAGLLAELDTQGNASTLVLDDPVTSLDHNYREHVAIALAREASKRQVIVLTHDVVLLVLLKRYASENAVDLQTLSVERGGADGAHGRVGGEAPWETLKVKDRVARLRQQLEVARRTYREGDRNDYNDQAAAIYERLREAWERAVEEVLLNGAVERFDVAVHTKKLRLIADDVTAADVALVGTEVAKCSTHAHDKAARARARPPGPPVVEQDITTLGDWIRKVRARRKR